MQTYVEYILTDEDGKVYQIDLCLTGVDDNFFSVNYGKERRLVSYGIYDEHWIQRLVDEEVEPSTDLNLACGSYIQLKGHSTSVESHMIVTVEKIKYYLPMNGHN